MLLVAFLSNGGAGVMVEVSDPGVKIQEFLCAFPPVGPPLTSLLSPCRTVRLSEHVVTAPAGNHLLLVDVSQVRDLGAQPYSCGADRYG